MQDSRIHGFKNQSLQSLDLTNPRCTTLFKSTTAKEKYFGARVKIVQCLGVTECFFAFRFGKVGLAM